MAKEEAAQRIRKLKELINRHRYLYHVQDRQEISEAALDSLKKELFDLERKFPEFITSDSPTQRVGGRPLEKFEKAKHYQPMLSLNDAFSPKDMEDWLDRVSKILTEQEKKQIDFYCELKIDGLAIELVYQGGILKQGSTRGDGQIGEDVTQNLKTIEAIPLKLEIPRQIVVRGEVFCSKKELERINKEQKRSGLPEFANPRNLAAGSIRQLDPKITVSRRLDSFAYDLITDLDQKTHQDKHGILKNLGFKTNSHNKYCQNLGQVLEFHNFWQKEREKLPYEIDGIVVVINNNKIFKKLGVVGKAPRAAIAFKFPLKQAATVIEDIKVQVGRTGAITPVALLKPVEIGGATISRATLHNENEIKRLGIKIGDTIIVGRAGDVIPAIIKVLPELRTGREKEFKMPKFCPSCGGKLAKPAGEALWRCLNPGCFAKLREYFYHFVSRNSFDIVGLGPKIIDRLVDKGMIQDTSDLFRLKEGDILPLERFAERSSQNLISAIQARKKIVLSRFIYALGIRNVGEKTANDLAEYFGSVENLQKAFFDDLQKITDVGPIVAKSIHNWFKNKKNSEFLEKLKEAGVKIQYQKSKIKNQKLQGLTFVLTGSLETLAREKAKEIIRQLGGDISESVSKNTNFLIAGKEPGLKYEKAKKLGVKIINKEEFLKIVQ